jgi:NADH:ubiquinone oxidoreductase subunit D
MSPDLFERYIAKFEEVMHDLQIPESCIQSSKEFLQSGW